jgi:hypothetical protein
MAIDRLATLAERFLTERSFTLIVAPALADYEFERARGASLATIAWVVRAMTSAACEDVANDLAGVGTFLAMALLPAFYYAFLFVLCAPWAFEDGSIKGISLSLMVLTLSISTLSAIACFWPERIARPREPESR